MNTSLISHCAHSLFATMYLKSRALIHPVIIAHNFPTSVTLTSIDLSSNHVLTTFTSIRRSQTRGHQSRPITACSAVAGSTLHFRPILCILHHLHYLPLYQTLQNETEFRSAARGATTAKERRDSSSKLPQQARTSQGSKKVWALISPLRVSGLCAQQWCVSDVNSVQMQQRRQKTLHALHEILGRASLGYG